MQQEKLWTKAKSRALKEKLHEMHENNEISITEIMETAEVSKRTAERYVSLNKKGNMDEYERNIPLKQCPVLDAFMKRKRSLIDNAPEEASQEKAKYYIDRENLACHGKHRRFYKACYNNTLEFLVEELPKQHEIEATNNEGIFKQHEIEAIKNERISKQREIEAIKKRCFPKPNCDYEPTFTEDVLHRNQSHIQLLEELRKSANHLRELAIKVVVPNVSVWCAHTLQLMKSYFELPRLQLLETNTSRTSVDDAKHDHEVDFIVAACATFLMSADTLSKNYRFGSSIYRVHQEVLVYGNVQWDSGNKIPMYFLENATGQIDYLKLSKERGDRITKKPLPSAEEVLKKIKYRGRSDNFLVSLWEPELSREKEQSNLRAVEHHDHLVGFFVNTDRNWRDEERKDVLGNKERAFYDLFTYASFLTRPVWTGHLLNGNN